MNSFNFQIVSVPSLADIITPFPDHICYFTEDTESYYLLDGTTLTEIFVDVSGFQGELTLTTTGSSGPATLIGNTLNIPQYSGGGGTLDGSGATNRVALWSDTDTLTYSNLIEGYESGGMGQLVVNSADSYQAIYGGYWNTVVEGSSTLAEIQLHTIGSSWSSNISIRRSRGTKAAQTDVLLNDSLGTVSFVDFAFVCAEISAIATEDHTPLLGGTKLNFAIAKNGTGVPFDVLTLDGDGRVKISDAYKLPLTDGSPSQVLSTDGAGSVSWVDNTGGPSSQSNQILAMTELTSTALTTYTIQTGANFQAINLNSDGTNRYAKITFVAPASGHVSVEMTFDMTIINSAAVQMIGLHTSSTATTTPAKGWYRINSDDDSSSGQYYADFRLTGLTPGTSYTYYFMAVCDFTGNTIRTSTQQSGAYSVAADLPAPLRITAYDLGTISVVNNPSS
jgi:hypothetical protein